jgi:hypothetical protein
VIILFERQHRIELHRAPRGEHERDGPEPHSDDPDAFPQASQ